MELIEDVAAVAGRLEAAFAAGPDEAQTALCELYAAQVELRHDPALPSDGEVDGAHLAEVSTREAAAIGGALPDLGYEDIAVTVDGNRIRITVTIVGTLATGRTARLPSDMRCTVRDGAIVGLEHHMGAEAMAAWIEVAEAGGLGARNP